LPVLSMPNPSMVITALSLCHLLRFLFFFFYLDASSSSSESTLMQSSSPGSFLPSSI